MKNNVTPQNKNGHLDLRTLYQTTSILLLQFNQYNFTQKIRGSLTKYVQEHKLKFRGQ